MIHYYDASTLAKFAGLLQAKGKDFRLSSQSEMNSAELQSSPSVLIGLMNNTWSERLMPQLRFTVERPVSTSLIIRDHFHPASNDWSVDYKMPYLDTTRDYAIVLRMVDPKTGQVVVCAAGLTVFGTWAAGEFLTHREQIQKLEAVAPANWQKMNMELVLATNVARGKPAPASIVAAQFW
jgi:hypothetical protein